MIRSLSLLLSALIFAAVTPLHAQSQGAAAANSQAYELFAAGDFQGAATAYEKLLKDYPTDSIVSSATVQLAYSYYLLTDFAKAEATLTKARTGPPLSPELAQTADLLTAQIALAKAGTLPATDPKRKAGFDDAAKKFGDFIAKAPATASDLESAYASKAIAEYQNQNFDAAVKDLETALQKFAKSSTIASTKYLLAITLATQASQSFKQGADNSAAFAIDKRAIELLREIISKKDDVTLINEANFQLGQILFSQAAYSTGAERDAFFKEALAAFSAVMPKDKIIELQKEKIKTFPELRKKATLARNEPLRKQLERDGERELKKLGELQAKPDQVATALQKIGEIYFQQQNYNAARVVFQHVKPFLNEAADQKENLYYITMTYALQNVEDKAVAGYTEFNGKSKADPLGDNLPFTLGQMYLNLAKPNDAIRLFEESSTIYPNGRLAGLSIVSKATAEVNLGKFDDAMRTFQSQLGKPNVSPEIGVVAQAGIADIYRRTQKWDDAIAASKAVKDKYPGTPQAAEADYYIGFSTQQKGDNAAAIPLLEAFAKANPQSQLTPVALYLQAAAQLALGQQNPAMREQGFATSAALAKNYPKSGPASYSYFQRAQVRGQDGKTDEVVALMKEFIQQYPEDDKVYTAYDTIAKTQIAANKQDDAAATYREFVQNYPEAPKAPEALVNIAGIQYGQATALGRYGALSEQERALWKPRLDGSIATAEDLIKKYPESAELSAGLNTLLADQRLLIDAGLKQPADVESYFMALAGAAASESAKSKLQFALAGFISGQDKAKAFTIMSQAYKPDVIYSPQDLDAYGLALLGQKKLDEANAVFEKLAANYPTPPGMAPSQAPKIVTDAQATSLFGRGRVLQEKGQTAEAGALFQQLKTLYPWSPKGLDADYGIAAALKQQGKLDEASGLLNNIISARGADIPTNLRAKAMLLGGDIMVDKMNAATDPEQKKQFLGAAIDYYLKIGAFYPGEGDVTAKGLWLGGQLIEQQIPALAEPKKAQQIGVAKDSYKQLIKDFPKSEYAPKAQERLTALGGP